MDYRIGPVLIDRETLSRRVRELGARIAEDYKGQRLTLICVLRGAAPFTTDLAKAIGPDVDVRLEFMRVSSYGSGTVSTGEVKILQDLDYPVRGEHLLIVEDIIDSGLTLSKLQDYLRAREPASLKLCALLDKSARRQVPVEIHYRGFEIPDEFVIGYGLDYDEHWRHLEAVHVAVALEGGIK